MQDKINRTALPVIYLVETMKPDVVDFALVKQAGAAAGGTMKDEVRDGCESEIAYADHHHRALLND